MFCRSVHFSSCFSNRQRWRHVTSSEIYRFEKQVFFSPLREQINDKLPTGSISRWPLFFCLYCPFFFWCYDALANSWVWPWKDKLSFFGLDPDGDLLRHTTHWRCPIGFYTHPWSVKKKKKTKRSVKKRTGRVLRFSLGASSIHIRDAIPPTSEYTHECRRKRQVYGGKKRSTSSSGTYRVLVIWIAADTEWSASV